MRRPTDLIENLKLGRQVTIQHFYAPYWSLPDFLDTPVTFLPYKPGELQIKDLVVAQLDLKTGFEVTREEAQARGCGIVEESYDAFYFIEIGKLPINGVLYAYTYHHYSAEDNITYYTLYMFTEVDIYGKAIDLDRIFSDVELSDGQAFDADRITPQDTSQLDVQYYLLAASSEPAIREIRVLSATKELYPSPVEFWLDCEQYIWDLSLDSRPFRSRNFYESPCIPLPVTNINLILQQWLDSVTEKPAEIIPLADVKRAMFMIYNGMYGQAFFVETEDKWFVPILVSVY